MRSNVSVDNNKNYARIPKIKQGTLLSLYIVYMQYTWTISSRCVFVAIREGIGCARCWRCTKPSQASASLCVVYAIATHLLSKLLVSALALPISIYFINGFVFVFISFLFL